jgi:haloalkane dehalogenase
MGCGLSDKPEGYNYTLKQRIDDLEKLIKFLDIDSFNLVVHDWGGAIGMGLATRFELMAKKIVILNTGAFRSKEIPFSISLCKNKYFGEFLVRALNGFSFPATFMTTVKKLPKLIKQGYLAPHNNYKNRKSVYEFVKDIPLDESHQSYEVLADIESKLPNLIGDKLILWGAKDFCFNDHYFARWRDIYPDAAYRYYKDAGHYVLEDKRDEVVMEVLTFLGRKY